MFEDLKRILHEHNNPPKEDKKNNDLDDVADIIKNAIKQKFGDNAKVEFMVHDRSELSDETKKASMQLATELDKVLTNAIMEMLKVCLSTVGKKLSFTETMIITEICVEQFAKSFANARSKFKM